MAIIGKARYHVNGEESRMAGNLIASLACLALWVTFTFVRPFGLGIIHILWAASVVFFIRWWALQSGNRLPVSGTRVS